MAQFNDYHLETLIAETPKCEVYWGYANNQRVVIKLLKKSGVSARRLADFKREYDIAQKLAGTPGVVRAISLEEDNTHQWAIVFEDRGGVALSQLDLAGKMELGAFLSLGIQLSKAIAEMHQRGIIHKDINPSNILLNPETDAVELIDFGVSSALAQEVLQIETVQQLEGTLAYIAPEQTGRMNRPLDYRADLYSLGATLYELLAGRPPFVGYVDPLEVIYAHLAEVPPAPQVLNAAIPGTISDIVMKLLSKDSQRRYQSASGVEVDLERCLESWQDSGQIPTFPLAEADISNRFQIPDKLYGRELQSRELQAAFERGRQGRAEVLLLAGEPGIGKTALARELNAIVTVQHGYFIEGKFGQLQRDKPYSALTQALGQLMKQLVAEGETRLVAWRTALIAALGNISQVMIDVIPELQLIIGPQGAVPDLPEAATQTRFNLAFQNLLRALAKPEHPLVVFLDDLQWADLASLKLLEWLLTDPGLEGLLVLGSYRINEVSAGHALLRTFEVIDAAHTVVTRLAITALDGQTVQRLVVDTLKAPSEQVQELADLIYHKTGGNPFFLHQFLLSLYQRQLFSFSGQSWRWQMDKIQEANVTDNVVELMRQKIGQLLPDAQDCLKIAAVIGNTFSLKLLSSISQRPALDVANALWPALLDQVVMPLDADYKFARVDIADFAKEAEVTYRFAHDRVQQAAYELIDESQRRQWHWRIGWQMWGQMPIEELGVRVFDVVNHLNAGQSLLQTAAEHRRLLDINQAAAQRALNSAAYGTALNYFQETIALLGEQAWVEPYALTLRLHTAAADAARLAGHPEVMESYVQQVLERAANLLDRVDAYYVWLDYLAMHDMQRSFAVAGDVLAELGEQMPIRPSPAQLEQEMIRTRALLQNKTMDELRQLPELADPVQKAILKIVTPIMSASYQSNPPLMAFLTMRGIQISVQYGQSPFTPYFYTGYSIRMYNSATELDLGYRLGCLAVELMRTSSHQSLKPSVLFVFHNFIQHWTEHEAQARQGIVEVSELSLELGNILTACHTLRTLSTQEWLQGSLPTVRRRSPVNIATLERYKDVQNLTLEKLAAVCVTVLSDPDNPPWDSLEQEFEVGNLNAYCQMFRAVLRYIFRNYDQAQEASLRLEKLLPFLTGNSFIKWYYFYDSLIHLALCLETTPDIQEQYLARVVTNQSKLSLWMDRAPMNNTHRWHLVEAERERVLGHSLAAAEHYDQAIAAARQNQFLAEEAMACERAGEFYLAQGRDNLAIWYLQDAVYAYEQWGALAKKARLEAFYPQLFSPASSHQSGTDRLTFTPTTALIRSASLDELSIVKAFQVISKEIQLSGLLKTLMHLTAQNAGAQQGSLIIRHGDELLVDAALLDGQSDVRLLNATALFSAQNLPVAPEIVQYVARTQDTVVLDNAAQAVQFNRTAYVQEYQPRSVLCAPLVNQGQLVGVIYLENNLSEGVFTQARAETIRLLSTQMAIALNNAILFNDLQNYRDHLADMVADRTRDLEIASEVSRKITSLMSLEELLRQVVERTRQAFALSYVAVFLYDDSEQALRLQQGSGEVGETLRQENKQFALQDQSLPSTAARSRKHVLLSDVLELSEYSTSAYLPHTRAELALPMQIGDKLIGVLDLQSDLPGRFADSDVAVLTSLSEQLAIAIENARLYAEQERNAERLRTVDAMKSQFLASMSHELRTPLNAILNFSEFVVLGMLGSVNEEQTEALNNVMDSGRHLLALINDVLDMSKIEAGMLTLFVEENIDLSEELNPVLAAAQALTKDKAIALKVNVDSNLPSIIGDRRRIRQILLNLLSNAVKFTTEGSVTINISEHDDEISFAVIDTGPGIAAEDQDLIFEPFKQTESGIQHGGGTGLGLPICRRLVEAHGGRMWLESQPGTGASFYFTLPIASPMLLSQLLSTTEG